MTLKERYAQLFVIKKHKHDWTLHWRIDATHSAPTGEWVNVDGITYHVDYIMSELMNNKFVMRKHVDGKRIAVRYESLNEMRRAA